MSKVLVSYFSATGTTREKSKELAKEVNGELFEIIPKQIYTEEDLNWNNPGSRSSVEIKNKYHDYNINIMLDIDVSD